MATPLFNLPEVAGSTVSFDQFNIILRLNEALSARTALNFSNTALTNNDGDIYIVGSAPTGDFTGEANNIAVSVGGAWYFLNMGIENQGFRVYDQNSDREFEWNGTNWLALRYTENIGDGVATTFTLTHDMNSRLYKVEVFRNGTPWETIIPDTIERPDTNNVFLDFGATVPTTDEFTVLIQR